MTKTQTLNNYKFRKKRPSMAAILKATKGFGKYQKGEDVIACTYPNADKAVEAILKSLKD